MSAKLLYSTSEIFKDKCFTIPPYQRGYKWETKDIEQLLDDIYAFSPNEDLDLFYCLQNITIVLPDNETRYNVVDGQQRLTTLMIVLSYLKEYDLIKNKICYAVRQETQKFIEEYIFKGDDGLASYQHWDDFLKAKGEGYDFQDIYYIFQAYHTVSRWFDKHHADKEPMRIKILNNVKLIVNLVHGVEEQELFENLNGKRVPLDGADLIRALIITRVAKREVNDEDDAVKRNVLMNERRVRIGLLLDRINLWWMDENRKKYFSYFTKEIKVTQGSSVAFNEDVYPINHLYKLLILTRDGATIQMDSFEKLSQEPEFMNELQLLQRTIEDWYNDPLLYHLILFAKIYAGTEKKECNINRLSFKELCSNWKSLSRRDFIEYLKTRIKSIESIQSILEDNQEEQIAFKENWYDDKLTEVSVLLDITSLVSGTSSSMLSSKLPVPYFKTNKEDFEHIFPQTPIGDKIKDKSKQTQILNQYLQIVNSYIKNEEERIKIDPSTINWDDQEWKEEIKALIKKKLDGVIPINSLGNLCLLDESVNRGYGNDFFLEKRIDIMRKSQDGHFIRPHVYAAFNKIFLEREDDHIDTTMMSRWDTTDILSRRKYIIQQIKEFLN